MGFFKKKAQPAAPVAPQGAAFAPSRAPLAVSLDAYPSATAQDRESMAGLVSAFEEQRGTAGFTAQQCAAISTLCERLVADKPELAGFVSDLRRVAEEEMHQGNTGQSWRWLATNL